MPMSWLNWSFNLGTVLNLISDLDGEKNRRPWPLARPLGEPGGIVAQLSKLIVQTRKLLRGVP